MRIIVIGGTGFIGLWVVRRLLSDGHVVALFHRGRTAADLPPGVAHIHGERQNLPAVISDFRRFAPEVVLDMFPYTKQDAELVVQTFRGVAGRVVGISSMDVYRAYGRFCRLEEGPPEVKPFAEDAPLRSRLYPYRAKAHQPSDPTYDYEKILVEQALMGDTQLPGTILRLPQVYGAGDWQHRLFEFLKRMIDRRPIILLEERRARWRWTRGYVENVATAIALAVTDDRASGRIYNVGDPEAFTELDWVKRIAQTVGWTGTIRVVPGALLPKHLALPYDWQHHLVADTTRIRQELQYADRVSVEEALRKTVAWETADPPRQIDASQFDYRAEDATITTHGF